MHTTVQRGTIQNEWSSCHYNHPQKSKNLPLFPPQMTKVKLTKHKKNDGNKICRVTLALTHTCVCTRGTACWQHGPWGLGEIVSDGKWTMSGRIVMDFWVLPGSWSNLVCSDDWSDPYTKMGSPLMPSWSMISAMAENELLRIS